MDGEGAGTQLPSTDLPFPSSGPGLLSSGCTQDSNQSDAASAKPSLIVVLEAALSCSALITFRLVLNLNECVCRPS